jgi:hypothetical protein
MAALAFAAVPLGAPVPDVRVAGGWVADLAVTGLSRPVQLARDGAGRLVVLGHGPRGDAAAEIVWLDVRGGELPVDASRSPRVVVPFSDGPRKITFGSLAIDTRSGALYLGEENGNRVYRLAVDKHLVPVAVGLQHLVGGSSIALDAGGRLVVLDFASSETERRSESPAPPGLESLAAEAYQGPLVFRVDPPPPGAPPRRLDVLPPWFPRAWIRPTREPLSRFISVAPLSGEDLALLDSLGQVMKLDAAGTLRGVARLPAGHYHRTNIAVAPDGSLFVSSGFHVRQVFRVSPDGDVAVVASELGDAGGIVVDDEGRLYVADTALHRVIRIVRRPRPSRP